MLEWNSPEFGRYVGYISRCPSYDHHPRAGTQMTIAPSLTVYGTNWTFPTDITDYLAKPSLSQRARLVTGSPRTAAGPAPAGGRCRHAPHHAPHSPSSSRGKVFSAYTAFSKSKRKAVSR